MRIKICGITRTEQGKAIVRLGASALGFMCVETSPRYIPAEQISEIVDDLPADSFTGRLVDRVGVFANAELEVLCHTVTIGKLNGVQLHGSETPEFCQQVRLALPGVELIKALRIKTPECLEQVDRYRPFVDTFLLDAYHPHLLGGTGKTLNWSWLQDFKPDRPWFLAGGLNPTNISDALTQLHPNGIDLSSGVERAPGDKDLNKVAQLFQVLQECSIE